MFDWVLNTPLNTITIFFLAFPNWNLWLFQFFSTINFPYQYLLEAKANLEPSQIFYNGAFSRNIFFCKIHSKAPVLEPHFNKVAGLYPEISLKERTPTQVFSSEFCQILKTPFLQNTSRRLLLFYRKNAVSTKQ